MENRAKGLGIINTVLGILFAVVTTPFLLLISIIGWTKDNGSSDINDLFFRIIIGLIFFSFILIAVGGIKIAKNNPKGITFTLIGACVLLFCLVIGFVTKGVLADRMMLSVSCFWTLYAIFLIIYLVPLMKVNKGRI